MKTPYNHITHEERIKIEALRNEGLNKNEIAERLGRHRSTIGRELERNFEGVGGKYQAKLAQKRKVKVRQMVNKSLLKIVVGSPLALRIEEKIRLHWSPEQIAGRFQRDNKDVAIVCHETIYTFIYTQKRDLIPFLRQGHKRRYRRRYGTKIREKRREEMKKKRIDTRPKVVEKRLRVGDWEGDTIVGKEKTIHILTHVDRKSGLLLLDLLPQATSRLARKITTKRFKTLPKKKRFTCTYDNGVQFSEHETLERDLKIDIYFAYPYHSWERGTNENTNGLVRQFFPKGSNFSHLKKADLKRVENLINNRPRKRHGYATPAEVF